MSTRWLHWFALVAAVLLLDVSLTFHNIWPTPAVSWRGEVSVELAAYILILVAAGAVSGRLSSSAALRLVTAIWIVLVIGRYADVTATALFGRDINLYWDLRFIPDVVSLLAKAAHVWLVLGVTLAIAIILSILYVVLRWALGRVADAAVDQRSRVVIAVAALLV